MSSTLTVYDETATGERVHSLTLDFLADRITVRELIRRRVYEEVREYNASTPEYFRGLVQPKEAERVLNGFKLRERRKIDWEEQFQRAVEAFQRNGFFILLDDRQAESLDQEFDLKIGTEVSFVKLTPLVGG
jgi:hypothetical protein